MALNKIRQLDRNSYGITLPKDDLRVEGLLDENGELKNEHHVHIRHDGDGEWTLERVEGIDVGVN
ncbi:hypothetical protein [Natronobacterium gregoryi]|uniref:DUF8053 domain-containing protein n=2 Tax=Natronobacterium gregoryi TaxID=44930 RepID=L0ADB8_NATGS|nr:hypothetical protein [Natronobacterium gregoryi]AFZ71429.1 hypothetical protein Natgr_0165 [Natronobacterium gregoryi SP2]ELY66953.1 hypothetical protein C490_11973 [Natronobacterium gregoryi SP2]PLK21192.1 hypothetical protein CYV19_05075 [Natronobacterium gregoryi SP2]SFI84099.1 hypothetical protein SAMN05443661_1075 [Natronobacterium gregoryi]